MFIEANIFHGRRRLGDKHIELPFIFLVQFHDLLVAIHDLSQVAARVILRPLRLVPLERELVIDVGVRVVYQLKLDALHWLDRINVDDTDAPPAVGAGNLEEILARLVSISQKVELFGKVRTYAVELATGGAWLSELKWQMKKITYRVVVGRQSSLLLHRKSFVENLLG